MTKKSARLNLPILRNLILLTSILVLLILGLIIYGIDQKGTSDNRENDSDFFCGTVSAIDYLGDSTLTIYAEGNTLFKNNCAACHSRNTIVDAIGPALKNVEERWADYPREDLYSYIRNSQFSLENKHPKAIQLWKEWQPTIMNAFPNLTDEEIEAILVFIENN
jgi:cytochrome c551/c552